MNIPAEWKRLLDGMSLPVMILDRDFRFRYFNDAYLETVHRDGDNLLGEYVFDAFPETPERIESVLGPWRRTLEGETTTLDALPFHVELEDGHVEELFWQATQDPIRDESGAIIGLIQRTQDITERYKLQQRNEAIGHELSHRVKNIMAVVSSVARITGRNAGDVKTFVLDFTARLNAMSRTNDLLSIADWRGLEVSEILADELSPYQDGEEDAFSLSGPAVRLSVDASKDLSMVCHELATNAAKYGCLGQPGGRLDIVWTKTGDTLELAWRESCPHTVTPSDSVGFGTRLFDMLPYVTVQRDFTPSGLHLTIRMDGEKAFA
ncbi:MAG: HWE histidine kinase domain-containing protein [Pseudomonadota bacterium]